MLLPFTTQNVVLKKAKGMFESSDRRSSSSNNKHPHRSRPRGLVVPPFSILRHPLLLSISIILNVYLFYMLWTAQTVELSKSSSLELLFHQKEIEWNGGHPSAPQTGTCYCNHQIPKEYCLCTPQLAIDTIILSQNHDYVWLVRRRDTDQLATLGGFVQMGETAEAAVLREIREEMQIEVPSKNVELFGVYSDPRRDNRRHTVSAVYTVELNDQDVLDHPPKAGDDAKSLFKVPLAEVGRYEYFADHKTILLDYYNSQQTSKEKFQQYKPKDRSIVRSVCGFDHQEMD